MRISDNMRYGGFVPAYQSLLSQQINVQQQISSGTRIQKLSDDPNAALQAQAHTQHIDALDQNNTNIGEANDWSLTTDTVLTQGLDILQRARDLAVQAGDGTMGATQRQQMIPEINNLLQGLVDMGSQSHLGNTVLSGNKTGTNAFSTTVDALNQITAVTYNGDGGSRSIEVEPGRVTAYNVLGSNENGGSYGALRDTTAGVDAFQTLIDLRNNINANNVPAISNTSLADLDKSINHLLQGMTINGSTQNRLTTAQTINTSTIGVETDARSKLQDTDLASAAIQLAQLQTTYQASLKTGANLMQTSLLDYLR